MTYSGVAGRKQFRRPAPRGMLGPAAAAIVLMGVTMTCGCNSTATTRNIFPGAHWQVSDAAAEGMDAALFEQAMASIPRFAGKDGGSQVVVIRNGYVIWQASDVTKVHQIWSCTKSFLSTCFGLLWDDGLVHPDDLASKYWPAMKEKYPEVTLRHLATFTSGVEYKEQTQELGEPRFAPGTAYHYSSESTLLAVILTRIAKRPLHELFAERIGGPLGIGPDDLKWELMGEVDGIVVSRGSQGVSTNALTLARFGWLFANDGVWNGKRLISQRYIDFATVPQTSVKTPPSDPTAWYVDLPGNYGFNWWTNGPRPRGTPHWASAPARMYAAQGNKNNICFIIAEWNMVVVRMGEDEIIDMDKYEEMFALLAGSVGAKR